MEVGQRFYSPEYLWQWWKGKEHLLYAGILPGLYVFDAHNYFIDCILLLILYVEVNRLKLSNFPSFTSSKCRSHYSNWNLLVSTSHALYSSLPFPWGIIFISLVFFKANKFDKQSFFWPPAAVWTQIDISLIFLAVPWEPQEMFLGWLHPGICDSILPYKL